MKQLDHPHIVKVGEYLECPVAFQMDCIDGANLRDFTGTQSPSILAILTTIAETLQHAHERGVVHRDVKLRISL